MEAKHQERLVFNLKPTHGDLLMICQPLLILAYVAAILYLSLQDVVLSVHYWRLNSASSTWGECTPVAFRMEFTIILVSMLFRNSIFILTVYGNICFMEYLLGSSVHRNAIYFICYFLTYRCFTCRLISRLQIFISPIPRQSILSFQLFGWKLYGDKNRALRTVSTETARLPDYRLPVSYSTYLAVA